MSINLQELKNNKYFKFLGWVAILIIATWIVLSTPYINVLINIFGEYGALIFALNILLLSVLLTILLLAVLEWLFNLIDNFLYVNKDNYQNDLFYWLAEDGVSNKFLKSIFSKDASEKNDEISNIIEVKEILEEKLKYEVVNYRLFRTFLINRTKKSLLKKINGLLLSIFVGLVIKSQLPDLKNYLQNKVDNKNFIENITEMITVQGYSEFILYFSGIFIIYFLVYRFLLRFTENDRRVNNLISILDNLIEGKE